MTMLRASSLLQFSDKLLGSPASSHTYHSCAEKEAPVLHTSRGFSGPLGAGQLRQRRDHATKVQTDYAPGCAQGRKREREYPAARRATP